MRPALKEDIQAILDIYNQSFKDLKKIPATGEKELKQQLERLHEGRFATLVAESQDTVVGFASLGMVAGDEKEKSDRFASVSLHIKRDHFEYDLATRLLQAIEMIAIHYRFEKLFPSIYSDEIAELYQNNGYAGEEIAKGKKQAVKEAAMYKRLVEDGEPRG